MKKLLGISFKRHQNSRKNETEEKRKLRKQKDANYQKNRRWKDKER